MGRGAVSPFSLADHLILVLIAGLCLLERSWGCQPLGCGRQRVYWSKRQRCARFICFHSMHFEWSWPRCFFWCSFPSSAAGKPSCSSRRPRASPSHSTIVGIALGETLYFWSVTQIGVSRALPISGIYPLFTWVLAVLVLGEPITPRAVVGTVLVLLSLHLLTPASDETRTTTSPPARRGVFAAVAACVLWTISTTLLKIGVQVGANVVAVNAYRLPFSALALLMMLQLKLGKQAWQGFNRRNVPAFTAISLYSTGLGTILWVLVVEYLGAARAALLNTTAPLIGVPLSKLFLRERVNQKIALGALLSVIGVAAIIWYS